jgi:hypothetical protein
MRNRLGLLLILLPMIASAAFVLADSSERAHRAPAPKKLETPPPVSTTPATESSDDAHSQLPQPAPGEVIGVPMFA